MAENKIKRPDVLQRLKDKKGKREKVVKCALRKHLNEKILLPEIQKWVNTVSKATNRGSLIFNRLLLHCLSNNEALPDLNDQTLYVQCFNVGIGKLRKHIYPVEKVWKLYFQDFPKQEKICGDITAYKYAAKKYATNFKNSLVFTFEGRQKAFIRKWTQEHGLNKLESHAIRSAINGWKCKTEPSKEAENFINSQRQILGIKEDEKLTLQWLASHMSQVVGYFYFILSYMEKFEDAKRFTLAPISSIKSHYLTIDTTVLCYLMKNCGLVKCNLKPFMEMRDEHFHSVFKIKGLCSGKFSHMIQTDGISACFHFMVPKEEKKESNKKLRKKQRVIAIDPGRSNLIYGVEKLGDGKIKKYRLTRNSYYNSAGMKVFNFKVKKWKKDIEEAEKIFRRQSLKTTKDEPWKKFLEDYTSVYDVLWNAKTEKKWGRERFRVYCLKRKTLDKFFHTMKGSTIPVIAYGAAKFNPNSSHELSAPTTALSKRCSAHFPTVFVDEYNTTKICHCCDKYLCPVAKNDKREIRGLRWCSSTMCRTFLNRDLNAALNILRCFEGGTNRPHSLSRNSGLVKSLKPRVLYLRQGETKAEGENLSAIHG